MYTPFSAPFPVFPINPKSILTLEVLRSHHHSTYMFCRNPTNSYTTIRCEKEKSMGTTDLDVIMMNTRGEGRRGRKRMEKCVTKEEWCLFCYVGGVLMFCDQEDCIKACHPKCIAGDDSFVSSGNSWTCDAHSCFICHKGQDFNCVGCPKALCRHCIGHVEFVQIEGNKGLCRVCLNFGLRVEEKKDADIDSQFMEHFGSAWKIISERESLTQKDLRYAEDRMKSGKFYMSGCDSDENDERVKSDIYDTFPKNKKKSRSIPRLQYALIDPKNITMVYLKKRLVEKLVKEPRTLCDGKLIGSFVKIKADRNDRFDENIFKLLQITGTTWTCSGENDPEVLLHVSDMESMISINLLSNGDVMEYECKDLKIRIQRGLLKQPTVDVLEHKARILHEEITKHWITTELQRLQTRFNLACERRQRREMIEFEEKRERLLKSDEQAKLLNTIPHVVAAAEGELELLYKNGKDVEQVDESCLKTPVADGSHSEDNRPPMDEEAEAILRTLGQSCTPCDSPQDRDQVVEDLSAFSERTESFKIGPGNDEAVEQKKNEDSTAKVTEGKLAEDNRPPMDEEADAILQTLGQSCTPCDSPQDRDQVVQDLTSSERTESVRISPGDDEAVEQEKAEGFTAKVTEGNKVKDNGSPSVPLDDQDLKWKIITPAGVVSGPYALDALKCILEVLPFYSQYLMVRKGANRNDAIKIQDAINEENTESNVTEGNERVEDNCPVFDEQLEVILRNLPERCISATKPQPSVAMSEQYPKWNIIASERVEKGPYSLKSLKCVHDILASTSQYIIVWKEGESKDTAITLLDAVKLLC